MTTRAPRAAKCRLQAAPIPELAPVIVREVRTESSGPDFAAELIRQLEASEKRKRDERAEDRGMVRRRSTVEMELREQMVAELRTLVAESQNRPAVDAFPRAGGVGR